MREYMDLAEKMKRQALASGDQGYGAIIVKNGEVVGLGPSRVVVNTDPTGHAEMEAIRDAARRLGSQDLSGCMMVSTSQPCPMCETAAYWAKIDRLIHGTGLHDGGRPGYTRC